MAAGCHGDHAPASVEWAANAGGAEQRIAKAVRYCPAATGGGGRAWLLSGWRLRSELAEADLHPDWVAQVAAIAMSQECG